MIRVYRYLLTSPLEVNALPRLVHSSASIVAVVAGPAFDISCEETHVEDLDALMASQGYTRTAEKA